jgi:hypothetical protein
VSSVIILFTFSAHALSKNKIDINIRSLDIIQQNKFKTEPQCEEKVLYLYYTELDIHYFICNENESLLGDINQ